MKKVIYLVILGVFFGCSSSSSSTTKTEESVETLESDMEEFQFQFVEVNSIALTEEEKAEGFIPIEYEEAIKLEKTLIEMNNTKCCSGTTCINGRKYKCYKDKHGACRIKGCSGTKC